MIKPSVTAILVVLLTTCILSSPKALAGDDMEFNSDPSQEDFERIMQPLVNPIREMPIRQPGMDGTQSTFSYTSTHVAIPEEAETLSKSYFKSGTGSSMDISRFNVHLYDKKEKGKETVHSGVMLTFGTFPYSNQQLFGGMINLGTNYADIRVGYSTAYGSDLFAACAENAEVIVKVVEIPEIVEGYVGGGASKAGVAAWWNGMALEKKRVWFDRYAILGLNLPIGALLTHSPYSPVSFGGEMQYSTSPKQSIVNFRLSLSL